MSSPAAETAPLSPSARQTLEELIAAKKDWPGALLPILHDIQDALGFIPGAGVALIARALNLSAAEVHGFISYYPHFRSAAPGRSVLRICRAEACQSMGGEQLWAHARERLGLPEQTAGCHTQHETTADGAVTLEPVYCLGLCSGSPALAIDEQLHARVNTEQFDRLLDATRSAA